MHYSAPLLMCTVTIRNITHNAHLFQKLFLQRVGLLCCSTGWICVCWTDGNWEWFMKDQNHPVTYIQLVIYKQITSKLKTLSNGFVVTLLSIWTEETIENNILALWHSSALSCEVAVGVSFFLDAPPRIHGLIKTAAAYCCFLVVLSFLFLINITILASRQGSYRRNAFVDVVLIDTWNKFTEYKFVYLFLCQKISNNTYYNWLY